MLKKALIAEAIVFLGLSAWLTWYVVQEDAYRDNGISRWAAYDAQVITVVAVVSGVVVAAVAIYAAVRNQRLAAMTVLFGIGSATAFLIARVSMTN
jgi:hypothetical protein